MPAGKYPKTGAGFTLIELLVVISVIGLLASVIMVSLNSARAKARDAAIKSNLSGMRTTAALIYDSAGTYDTVCNADTDSGKQFRAAYAQGDKVDAENVCLNSDTTALWSAGGNIIAVTKAAIPEKWAASIRLKNGNYFCVDHSGYAQEQETRGIDNSPIDVDCI
ncbi:MAG: hypothetical protein A3C85_03685 [Candidatus Doudnabacteria bacterium RIFCSPHIGHO2_02_FULL_48_21]|nr:MAG: hypothetical protein A3K05_03180 [Candidatus Doudnabacteria bacterium RIFCSPHIGHO2_01_48_18]OGE79611.1 MAG: hypothetical protein A2668_01300 [Candidatus Doudnabacteria bacterium RIFCSPHIGHO2_01_FULL_48_180]OGE91745.1 MAG: hypothetical protein A3F44_00025 [Candidatus Doudnabacteria bacterium RIFCSPHIGHO2_12_FULL_47_25]OGE93558.1 MAG: hypothetical protein A3C85_03685 [Candidatus Doudnabacteria bacterium RIFCSPHIGHO2_02_FULL_48_21]OGE96323.1 MAG: hypothetical protein A3A83_00140 [Candidatu